MDDGCSLLPWDSQHWGFPVARIDVHRLTDQSARQAIRWCKDRKIRCLYFAADGSCAQTLQVVRCNGFRFIDIRVDLKLDPEALLSEAKVNNCRAAKPEDLPALQRMARGAHEDTRFFKDLHFDRIKAGDFYSLWIERDLRENKVFVAFSESDPGELLGYISVSLSGDDTARIGLMAVKAGARRSGLGRSLVEKALIWCHSQKIVSVRVATQGTNVPALRLYESCGFKIADVKVWFHRWFGEELFDEDDSF